MIFIRIIKTSKLVIIIIKKLLYTKLFQTSQKLNKKLVIVLAICIIIIVFNIKVFAIYFLFLILGLIQKREK